MELFTKILSSQIKGLSLSYYKSVTEKKKKEERKKGGKDRGSQKVVSN
jgi:hypothetical protein